MKKISAQSGFSLIEMLLIILVAGIVVVVIANIPHAINLIGVSNHESVAKQIVAKQISDIRSKPFDTISEGSTNIVDSRLTSLPKSSGTVLVEPCPSEICVNNEAQDVKKVTINVNWSESDKPNEFKIVTLVAKGGVK